MAITMDGIFVNGQKATFRPEDILTGDASAYTEEIGTAVEAWMEENVTGGEQVTDTTLTLPGVPADAEVTGSKIEELKEDLNNYFIPYTWLDGYYALGNGNFTPQTGTSITYHSTNKIDGDTIPPDSEFVNSGYLYLSDSFFAVWNNGTYVGYLMNGEWKKPSGSAYSSAPAFTQYAVVLHNVSNYALFGRRKYAVISETEAGVTGNNKASMVVDTVTFTNDDYVTYATSSNYAYKLTKRVFIKSISPYVPSGKTLYCYVLKRQSDGTYSTVLSKTFSSEAVWNIGLTLDKDDALLFGYSSGTQYYSSSNAKDYFTKTFGWNANTHMIVDSSLAYYIPATVELYDPISNYLLNYINNGNPCNWKGTECSLFDNILCIGDSITQGAPTPPDITPDPTKATRTVNNQTMYSYPASMKKQWGVECTNWGRSGIDTPDWYDYYSENEPSWSGHDAAIMLIGNNDYHIADDMGGLTPENLPTVSAMSKSAMMDIITKLKADNADIKIFICTLLPGWDIGNSLSPYVVQNIRDIASAEDNVYLIDLAKYSIIKGSSPYMYGHPTALGYNQLAREIGGAIGYTIVNNPNDFRWVQFIGTEYAMNEN